MVFPPRIRKFALTGHVTFSVGWMGAVACFLALAVAGLAGRDAQLVRGAYVALKVIGWFVLVPLSFASLLTGLIQALGTGWGLLSHYWILFKLVTTVIATALLLVHMQVAGHVAEAAASSDLTGGELAGMRVQLTADAGAALLVLLVAVALSVYKPRGMTRHGWRKLPERVGSSAAQRSSAQRAVSPGQAL